MSEPGCGELPDHARQQAAGPGHEGHQHREGHQLGGRLTCLNVSICLLKYTRFFLTNQTFNLNFEALAPTLELGTPRAPGGVGDSNNSPLSLSVKTTKTARKPFKITPKIAPFWGIALQLLSVAVLA